MKSLRHRARGIGALFAAAILLTSCGLVRLRLPASLTAATSTPLPVSTLEPTHAPRSTATVVPVTATSAPTPAATPQPPKAERIVLHAISGSLMLEPSKAAATLRVDGTNIEGHALLDEVTVERISADHLKQQAVVMSGGLTSRMLSYVIKSEVKEKMAQTGVYVMDGGSYWMAQYASDGAYNCIVMRSQDDDPFRSVQPLPEEMLNSAQQNLYGTLVGEEQINGIAVRHYSLDESATNAATQASPDWKVHAMARDLTLHRGEVYLAAEGDYLVRFRADYDGKIAALGFSGVVHLEFDLTRPGADYRVVLPQVCIVEAAQAALPRSIGKAELLDLWHYDDTVITGSHRSAITMTLNGKNLQGTPVKGTSAMRLVADHQSQRRAVIFEGVLARQLLGDAYPQLAAITRTTVYQIGDIVYVMAEGEHSQENRCVRISNDAARRAFSALTPEAMIGMLSTSPVYGVRARDERANGLLTWHYRVDKAATNKAVAQLQAANAGNNSPQLQSGDVYIAKVGGYVARLVANYTGQIGTLGVNGQFTFHYDLTPSEKSENGIQLPAICSDAISGKARPQGGTEYRIGPPLVDRAVRLWAFDIVVFAVAWRLHFQPSTVIGA